ncbi:MAG: tRNA lysidine(34) synthetase TilS [Phoenicibacter congonensis]|uniref:tRNA(Ile)-lysidine synthase n=1 Tax=Phoenicibacter congonensis TaxID=1944646 RepID=A0AA43RG42_9ACTN|nr:tRNA lysidine(34) synthetase TilS [Phoenicibacter congonensis]
MQGKKLEITTKRALQTVQKHGLFTCANPVLLMVSGGSDSTALCYIANELKKLGEIEHLAALHVNHKIRGAEADGDQEFVRELCAHLSIPLFEAEVDIPKLTAQTGKNLEAVARAERYSLANDALMSLCEHSGKTLSDGVIVTAHTLDDRAENFYMRSIVGTGPGGFRSMQHKNKSKQLARPLLDLTREELREAIMEAKEDAAAFTNNKGELWREDKTNEDTTNFRSFVRHKIIPLASERNEKHLETLRRTMDAIAEEDDLLNSYARKLLNETCSYFPQHKKAQLKPAFGEAEKPIAKRALYILMRELLPEEDRIEQKSIDAIMNCFENGVSIATSAQNIQGNFMVSSNIKGVIVETADSYRQRRKRI